MTDELLTETRRSNLRAHYEDVFSRGSIAMDPAHAYEQAAEAGDSLACEVIRDVAPRYLRGNFAGRHRLNAVIQKHKTKAERDAERAWGAREKEERETTTANYLKRAAAAKRAERERREAMSNKEETV